MTLQARDRGRDPQGRARRRRDRGRGRGDAAVRAAAAAPADRRCIEPGAAPERRRRGRQAGSLPAAAPAAARCSKEVARRAGPVPAPRRARSTPTGPRCPGCGRRSRAPALAGRAQLTCPGCGHRYDARRAGRCARRARSCSLEPVPLLADDGRAGKVALQAAVALTVPSRLRLAARRVARAPRAGEPAAEPQERCELCGEPIAAEHRHLARPRRRASCCARAARARCCSTGRRGRRALPARPATAGCGSTASSSTTRPGSELRIPVDMAFFFHSTPAERVRRLLPEPDGRRPSRCSSSRRGRELEAANPVLRDAGARRRGAAGQPRARRARALARPDRRLLRARRR